MVMASYVRDELQVEPAREHLGLQGTLAERLRGRRESSPLLNLFDNS